MQNPNSHILIDEADQLLKAASEELQRSEEDVTAFTVCYNSRQSIVNYLSSYLIKNGIKIKKPVSVANLMDQCRETDGRFRMIDISEIYCNHEENSEAYCLNLEKVNDCLRVARQIRNLTTSELPKF